VKRGSGGREPQKRIDTGNKRREPQRRGDAERRGRRFWDGMEKVMSLLSSFLEIPNLSSILCVSSAPPRLCGFISTLFAWNEGALL
jgi:hypothetical protein